MIEIGGMPILWHIMKIYSHFGVKEFIVCCGYKGYLIKEYFANFLLHQSDITIDLKSNVVTVHEKKSEDWRVTLVETGEYTQTGGRLKKVAPYLNESFCLTYGDGVGDINVGELIRLHKSHGGASTMTIVQPPGRFGAVQTQGDQVRSFLEKPLGDGGWVNGGFFVLEPSVLDRIESDDTVWEQAPLMGLAESGQLFFHKHLGFWQPMDTLRDKVALQTLWESGRAPWKVWG